MAPICLGQAGEPIATEGFENGLDAWGKQGSVDLDRQQAHSGEASLRISGGHVHARPTAGFAVTPDHDYRVSVWIRTREVRETGAIVLAVARGGPKEGDDNWLGGWLEGSAPLFVHDNGASPAILATGGTHDWQRFEATISSRQFPNNARRLALYLRYDRKEDSGGEVWFDDLTFEALPAGSVPVRSGPLIRNGGFEHGRQAWAGPGGAIDTEQAGEGQASLRVDTRFSFQPSIAVEGGKRYRLSMKVKAVDTEPEAAFVQMSYRGKGLSGWRGPVQVQLGNHSEPAVFVGPQPHDWREYSLVFQAPTHAQEMLLYLRKKGEAGTVWYDAVSLEPTDDPVTTPQELRAAGMAPAHPLVKDRDFARESLQNTGFEQGLEGWVTSGVLQTTTAAAEGQSAVEIIHGTVMQGLKVAPKRRYRLSVRVKTQDVVDGGASVRLVFRRPDGVEQRHGVVPAVFERVTGRAAAAAGGTADWRELSSVFEVPAGYDEVLITLYKTLDDGTAWFDDLRVHPTDEPAMTAADYDQQHLADLLPPAGDGVEAADTILQRQIARAAESVQRIQLAQAGQARYAVHVGSADEPTELHAAEELARYLSQITGGNFSPLSHDANPRTQPLLVVGRNNRLTEQLCPDIPYDELGEDGFVIRTAGPHVVIAGATPRGTLYGVYWLLDRELGVRWYTPEHTVVPHQADLSIAPPSIRQAPRFVYREIFSRDTDSPAYRQHNLLNGASHHRLNLRAGGGLDTWSAYWPEGGHNFHRVVNHKKYAQEHPEYFAGGQLAMMNPQVRQIAAESLVNIIRNRIKKGRDPAYGFSQEDRGWGADAQSKAFAAKHGGTLSAPLIDMMNDLARRVRQQIPDARLATLAYHWSFPPPTGIEVDPAVVMTVAPIHANFAHPFGSGDNVGIGEDIAQWAQIADHIVIWDYITNFGGFIQPFPNLEGMTRSIQWLAQFPAVQGYFGQGSYTAMGGEFSELRAWVAARLLWDPQQDADALVREFVAGHYGPAAPYIERYLALMHDSVRQTNAQLTIRTQVTAPYLSFEAMRQADRLFDQAEAAAADQPAALRRVQTARVGVDYVILLRRAQFAQAGAEQGIDWPAEAAPRIARFERYARQAGIVQLGEGVGGLNQALQSMRIERTVPQAPPIVEGLGRDQWVEYQDLDLRRYRGDVVGDPKASDGGALSMPGNIAVWGVQMQLDSLPQDGAWKLYAEVRVDPAEGKPQDRAMSFGVNPGSSRGINLEELADGEYHLLEVPGGAYRHDPGVALWFAPPKSQAVKAIYIDRVIAIRADDAQGADPAQE